MSATTKEISGRRPVSIPAKALEPQVEVVREGNAIKAIRVTCACGYEVDIECEYGTMADEKGGQKNDQ